MANQSDLVINGHAPDMLDAGKLQVAIAKYTPSAALAADSVVEMFPVKDDFAILNMDVYVEAFGAGRTIDVGDGALVDRYFDGLDVSSAAKFDLATDGDAAYIWPKEYTADDTIDIKVLGDTWPADKAAILVVYYKVLGALDGEEVD